MSAVRLTSPPFIQDLPLLQISHDDWKLVQAPKVKGAWNLHEALGGADLDFFILFSSLSGVYGNPGQANYAAANTFLQSFAQYRRSLDLPCSVIDLGIMEGIGFISRDPSRVSQMHAMGAYLVQEQDLIDVVQLSIERSLTFKANICVADATPTSVDGYCNPGQLVVGLKSSRPITDPGNRIWWRRDIRMGLYRQVERSSKSSEVGEGGLQSLLSSIDAKPQLLQEPASRELLTQAIGRMLCGLMLKPEESIQGTTSLSSMGIDSLVSIEIRNWWRRTLGDDLSVLEITNAGTVEGLGKMAITSLQQRYDDKPELVNGEA
ncbi:hypothetical protein CDD83_4282 [Cordyceps sp. RAO-2017]|nr:hypothetical protein CDD83_4282 [Cordyceps sp. RAO-2017]